MIWKRGKEPSLTKFDSCTQWEYPPPLTHRHTQACQPCCLCVNWGITNKLYMSSWISGCYITCHVSLFTIHRPWRPKAKRVTRFAKCCCDTRHSHWAVRWGRLQCRLWSCRPLQRQTRHQYSSEGCRDRCMLLPRCSLMMSQKDMFLERQFCILQ